MADLSDTTVLHSNFGFISGLSSARQQLTGRGPESAVLIYRTKYRSGSDSSCEKYSGRTLNKTHYRRSIPGFSFGCGAGYFLLVMTGLKRGVNNKNFEKVTVRTSFH